MNARCRPFGANAGLSLVPSPNVICRTSRVARSRILMSLPGPVRARERDLVERRRRPGRPVGVRLGRQPLQPEAVGAHDVDLRRAGAVRRERDLRAGRRPGRRDVDRRMVREPPHVRAVAVHHVDLGVAVAVEANAIRVPSGDQTGSAVVARVLRQLLAACPVDVRDEDVRQPATVRRVGDRPAVGRPGRRDVQRAVRP